MAILPLIERRRKEAERASYVRMGGAILRKKLLVEWLPDNCGQLGYTKCDIPPKLNILWYEEEFCAQLTPAERAVFRMGVFAHELLHQIFTAFEYTMEITSTMTNAEAGIFMMFANTIEDPAIEFFAQQVFGGRLLDALRFTIKHCYITSPGIEETNNAFYQLINALVHFGDMGIVKGQFTFPEAYEYFKLVAPLYNEAITCPIAKKRIDIAKECMEITKPLWEDIVKQQEFMDELMKKLDEFIKKIQFGGNGKDSNPPTNDDDGEGEKGGSAAKRRSEFIESLKTETEKDSSGEQKAKSQGTNEESGGSKGEDSEEQSQSESGAERGTSCSETSDDTDPDSEESCGGSSNAAKPEETDAEDSGSDTQDSDEEEPNEDSSDEGSSSEGNSDEETVEESNSQSGGLNDQESTEEEPDEDSSHEGSSGEDSSNEEAEEESNPQTGDIDSQKSDEEDASDNDSEDKASDKDSSSDQSEDESPSSDNANDTASKNEEEGGKIGDYEHDCTKPNEEANQIADEELYVDEDTIRQINEAFEKEYKKLGDEDSEGEETTLPEYDITSNYFQRDQVSCLNQHVHSLGCSSSYSNIIHRHMGEIKSLTKHLEKIFNSDRETIRRCTSGSYNIKRGTIGTTATIFDKRKDKGNVADTEIFLLVDQSGSMNGAKMLTARDTCIVMTEALSSLHIPLYVMGFTADDQGYDAIHFHYVSWKGTKREKESLAAMTSYVDNFDGYSIRYAGNILKSRPATNKILFVISDGQPASLSYENYYDGLVDTTNAIKEVRKASTMVFGVGIGDCGPEVLQSMYGADFIHVKDIRFLTKTLSKKLEKALKKRC